MRKIAFVACTLVAAAGASASSIDTASAGQLANGLFAVQNTQTDFGSADSLCNAMAEYTGGNLNLLFGGKLNTGYERLAVFIDTGAAGGSNVLPGGSYGLNFGGMKFDTAFSANYSIVINGDGGTLYMDFNTYSGGSAAGNYLGAVPWSNGGAAPAGGGSGNPDIRASVNNQGPGLSFGTGPLNGGDLAIASAYTTGVGLSIPLSALGVGSGATIRIAAMILGGDGSTMSTQVLGGTNGGAGGYPNAGGVDFTQMAGDQFFTIPTPGALAMLGLGGLVAGRRRR